MIWQTAVNGLGNLCPKVSERALQFSFTNENEISFVISGFIFEFPMQNFSPISTHKCDIICLEQEQWWDGKNKEGNRKEGRNERMLLNCFRVRTRLFQVYKRTFHVLNMTFFCWRKKKHNINPLSLRLMISIHICILCLYVFSFWISHYMYIYIYFCH